MNSTCSAARNQVTILGINSLFGKVVSFLLKQSPVANRLVLYDEVDTRVAHDIAEIPTPCKVVVYNGEEQLRCAVKNSDVILIGDKDDCLTNEDEAISRKATDIIKYANAISSMAPNAIVLIAATPVNSLLPLFTEAQIGCGTFDGDKVMGVTSADTMRASTLLARHMGIEPEKAYLPVIGGASADTRIPLFSQSRPNIEASKDDLKNLTRVVKMTEDELKKMLNRGEALNKAYATVQLIDSVMSALQGQRNISEIVLSRTCLVPNVDYFSLPVILGRRGIAHRFPLPSLTERESILLDHAVKHIEIDKMKGINALSGNCCNHQEPEVSEKYSELITVGRQKDFVGSLMEKFKLGAECSEVCEPRVEYKLLSKVKFKLPPEATPSEMPKRTKFIEPDTPPQDGCCPLKLPCPPIPPIRGLNQIQAKPNIESKDKTAVKGFFPPVEKSLTPCKLCQSMSNKPCADYGDYKTFHVEQSHCCGPISSAIEDSTTDIAKTPACTPTCSTEHPIAAKHDYSVQPVPQVTSCGSDANVLSNAVGEPVNITAQVPKQVGVQALWEYPRTETDRRQQQQTPTNSIHPPDGESSSPLFHRGVVDSQQFELEPKKFEPKTSSDIASKSSSAQTSNPQITSITNHTTQQTSIQSGFIQHEDPHWPFKCSTSLCLDILAPQNTNHKFTQDKPAVPAYHISNPGVQKKDEPQSIRNASVSPQIPESVQPVEQNTAMIKRNEQTKRYNYSSGLSLTNPWDTVEGIIKDPPERKESGPQDGKSVMHPSHQEQSNHAVTESSTVGIRNGCQPDVCTTTTLPNSEINSRIKIPSTNLKECYNNTASSPSQKALDHDSSIESSKRLMKTNAEDSQSIQSSESILNKQQAADNYMSGLSLPNPQEITNRSRVKSEGCLTNIKSQNTPEEKILDYGRKTDNKTLDERSARDEYVKKRIYATLTIIEDIKPEPKPQISKSDNSSGLPISQHFRDEGSRRIPKTEEPEGSQGNTMLSILRERARAINANMELQRDLRACLERNKNRHKDTLRIKNLIDTINPAKRLSKTLESRPALSKSYQGMKRIYEDPKHLGNQGKSASIVVTTKLGQEGSVVVLKDTKEQKKLSSRVDRIKERIQEALKKIIYPIDLEMGPTKKSKIQQRLSSKMVTRPPMRKSAKAKQDFFVQLRKTDPAYRPTTKFYAPKCPTRLLYDGDPKNHSPMITFNNVIENETEKTSSSIETRDVSLVHSSTKVTRTMKDTHRPSKGFHLPDLPNFPELILRETDSKAIPDNVRPGNASYSKGNRTQGGAEPTWLPKDGVGSNAVHNQNPQETRSSGSVQHQSIGKHMKSQIFSGLGSFKWDTQNRNPQETRSSGTVRPEGSYSKHIKIQMLPKDEVGSLEVQSQDRNPRETKYSGPVRLRGDYVKHFDTQLLPKDLNLPEWIKAAIKERRRELATPRSTRAPRFNDTRYRMTSPNRLTYPRKHN